MYAGWWFGTFFIFHNIRGIVIPTDELIFFRRVGIPPTSIYTSSTAQGGGGSFNNGKPIGEVSWCGAKMAERTH